MSVYVIYMYFVMVVNSNGFIVKWFFYIVVNLVKKIF